MFVKDTDVSIALKYLINTSKLQRKFEGEFASGKYILIYELSPRYFLHLFNAQSGDKVITVISFQDILHYEKKYNES